MSCCNDYGVCQQGFGCVCHQTSVTDAQEEYETTMALVYFFTAVLMAIALSAMVVFGVL